MDAFYASVEQRDNPAYRGKPLVVAGKTQRSVVSAASYEARKYGIRSAMPSMTALKKCPHLIFVPPRIAYYKEVSNQIMSIFKEYTDLVEPLSLDEAFLDVTQNKKKNPSATIIAKEIRLKIKQETGLTSSAGVSYCKFLAKIASDYNKPNGQFVITPDDAEKFIEQLPIEKFFGVGKATAKRLHELNIFTGKDLKEKDELYLIQNLGKAGVFFYQICRGIDNRPVNPSRERKSVGAERTFMEDIYGKEQVIQKIDNIVEILIHRLERAGKYGKTLTVKIKYEDFIQHTRSITSANILKNKENITSIAYNIINAETFRNKKIRLLGLSISNFESLTKKNLPIQLKIEFPDFQ